VDFTELYGNACSPQKTAVSSKMWWPWNHELDWSIMIYIWALGTVMPSDAGGCITQRQLMIPRDVLAICCCC